MVFYFQSNIAKRHGGDCPHKPLAFDQMLVNLFLLFVLNFEKIKILFKPKDMVF